jgi:predicted enzyme related to lactoylglutathione lyase
MYDVSWFEVVGRDADRLRVFYGELFGWRFQLLPEGDYGVVAVENGSLPGGVGKAADGPGWTTFYVKVPDVAVALARVAALGGKVVQPATKLPDGNEIGVFTDPEGHPVGLSRGP